MYWYVFVWTLFLHYQGRNFENSPVCIIIAMAECLCLVYAWVCMSACMCVNVSIRVWEMRGLLWPLEDRGSNEDVWLFQNPSAGIFLPSFTPSVSSQHTSSHLFKHTYTHRHTHSNNNPPFATTSTIIAFSQSWQIRGVLGIQSGCGLSLVLAPVMGGKTFISLLSCRGSISAFPQRYLDPLWLHIFKHRKCLSIISFLFGAD